MREKHCRVLNVKALLHSVILSGLLLTGLLALLGCGHRDYKEVLTGVNEVLILASLKEIVDSGAESIFLKFSKKIGGENGLLYRGFYRFSGNRKMKAYVPLIERLTTDIHSSRLRCEAIRTLGKINAWRGASARLKELLNDKDVEVVRTTIIAIAQLGKPEFVTYLKPLLYNSELAAYAIWCVGEIGKAEDATLIAPFLRSKNHDTAFIAFKALKRME